MEKKVWLIYKCSDCDAAWNAAVFSRVSPQSVHAELLDGFYRNDAALAERYAMDYAFLRGNGGITLIFHGRPPYLW